MADRLLLEGGSFLLLEGGVDHLLLEATGAIAPSWSIVDGGGGTRPFDVGSGAQQHDALVSASTVD